jgi:hypothetical protein
MLSVKAKWLAGLYEPECGTTLNERGFHLADARI